MNIYTSLGAAEYVRFVIDDAERDLLGVADVSAALGDLKAPVTDWTEAVIDQSSTARSLLCRVLIGADAPRGSYALWVRVGFGDNQVETVVRRCDQVVFAVR